jgi:hypothetical protein
MKTWLIEHALNELPPCKRLSPITFKSPYKMHLYKLSQCGEIFNKEENALSTNGRRLSLALVSPSQLPDHPSISYFHNELGLIECNLVYVGIGYLSEHEWQSLTDFHCVVFNARWRRKTKSKWFSFDDKLLSKHTNPYVIGCLDDHDKLHFSHIETVLDEFSRSLDQRKHAVLDYEDTMVSPRICFPTYSPNTREIMKLEIIFISQHAFPN